MAICGCCGARGLIPRTAILVSVLEAMEMAVCSGGLTCVAPWQLKAACVGEDVKLTSCSGLQTHRVWRAAQI